MQHNLQMVLVATKVFRKVFTLVLTISAWLVLALLLAQAAQAAQASTLVLNEDKGPAHILPAIEFFLDPTSQLSVADVAAKADTLFALIDSSKPYALENGTLWMRFDVQINNAAPHWRLTLPMPSVDIAIVHYRDAAGQWVVQQAGDKLPMSSWAQRGRYPAFSLSKELGSSVRYFVQVKHSRVPYSALPRIVSDAQFISSRQNDHLLLGIYFGLSALVVVLALAKALVYRDWGFGSYAIYVGLFAFLQASWVGIAALYMWPEMPALNVSATITLASLTAAAGLWFVRVVTSPRRSSKVLDASIQILIGMLMLVVLVNVAAPDTNSFRFYNVVLTLSMLVLFAAVSVALVAGDRYARWIAVGFLPVVVGSVLPLLRNIGMVSSGFLTDYGLMLGSAIEVPILYFGLYQRMAQGRSISDRASGLRYADALTGVYDVKILRLKLRQLLGATPNDRQPFAFLAIDLSNHAALLKKYNRDTSDRALIMAAARIRSVARSTDTVARIGDTQFGVLMEGSAATSDINSVATKILAAGLRATNELPEREPLRFNIVLTYLNESSVRYPAQANAVLAKVLAALAEMSVVSGKAIRLLKL